MKFSNYDFWVTETFKGDNQFTLKTELQLIERRVVRNIGSKVLNVENFRSSPSFKFKSYKLNNSGFVKLFKSLEVEKFDIRVTVIMPKLMNTTNSEFSKYI